jgi:hypothetical protein
MVMMKTKQNNNNGSNNGLQKTMVFANHCFYDVQQVLIGLLNYRSGNLIGLLCSGQEITERDV